MCRVRLSRKFSKVVLFHITGREAFTSIMACGRIKPGPKNVWVERKPTGYLRKGGKVWLVEAAHLWRVVAHLQNLGRPTEYVIGVNVEPEAVKRFNPMPGVYTSTRAVRVEKGSGRQQWKNESLRRVVAKQQTRASVGRSRGRKHG